VMKSISAKYALRSLLRHPRRSILSIVGVGVGCAIGIFASSWIGGSAEMQVRAASESGAGHLRVVPSEWPKTRENILRLGQWEQALAKVRALPGIKTTAVRARVNGLLAFGNRTAGAEVVGVDPAVEPEANRIVGKGRLQGRYLQSGDSNKVVIGKTLADRLDVELDDDLYVTLAGRDEISSAMLTIVGIIDTGSGDLDASICQVTLEDIERITGYQGPGEISILLNDYRLIASMQKKLTEALAGSNAVITWKQVNPGLAGNVEGDKVFTKVLIAIIVVVVSLGIASAQLTAVLERRHEFAILSALGMKGRHVVGLVVLEALLVGVAGAAVALLLGGSAAYYLATKGVNLATMMGEELSFENVLLDPYVYGDFGIWLIWYALAVSVIATVGASIYPAWLATKVEPADALRVI